MYVSQHPSHTDAQSAHTTLLLLHAACIMMRSQEHLPTLVFSCCIWMLLRPCLPPCCLGSSALCLLRITVCVRRFVNPGMLIARRMLTDARFQRSARAMAKHISVFGTVMSSMLTYLSAQVAEHWLAGRCKAAYGLRWAFVSLVQHRAMPDRRTVGT